MLKIEGKTFMNIQEAVQWLLDNNALPFQSTANYIGNTEIGMGTIVNPSPAKVRIGSLIFFADSKVSTVTGLTENGFICSDQYDNLVDDVAHVTNVAISASGHLITTMSDGQTIDAGLIKQVSGFSIDASQHLIVSFNDGTSIDLGAIFSGNITISGDLTASGKISSPNIEEIMSGYGFTLASSLFTKTYIGCVKTGNKITFAIAGTYTLASPTSRDDVGIFSIPSAVGEKIFGSSLYGWVDVKNIDAFSDHETSVKVPVGFRKLSDASMQVQWYLDNLQTGVTYYLRYELTLLLSDSLA